MMVMAILGSAVTSVKDTVAEHSNESVSISFDIGGGMGYGVRRLSATTRDGTFRLLLTDTENLEDFVGVGVFDGELSDEDRAHVQEAALLLCRSQSQLQNSPSDMGRGQMNNMPMAGYSATCGGTAVQGSLYTCPKEIGDRVRDIEYRLAKSFYSHGRKVVKLDVEAKVESQPYNFLVTVRFVNSGDRSITFKSPALWSGILPLAQLRAGGRNPQSRHIGDNENSGGFIFDLSGLTPINASAFPDDVIVIPPHETSEITFLAAPDGKYTHGTYDFGATVYADIHVDGPEWSGGHVDFWTGIQNVKRITIPRDYPATPQEWDDYEAKHRKDMLAEPVKAGGIVKEDGYYRPNAGEQQGRFVTRLLKGDFTPGSGEQQDSNGTLFTPTQWVWDSDIASTVEARSKTPCPKSGRWLANIPTDVPNAGYYLQRVTVVQMKAGDTLPAVGLGSGVDEERVRWVWIGP